MKLVLVGILVLLVLSGCTQPAPSPLPPEADQVVPDSSPPVVTPTPVPPSPVPPVVEPVAPETEVVVEPAAGPQSITMNEQPSLKWTGGYADASVVEFGGKYWMYLNQFGNGKKTGVFALSSTDGLTWDEETGIIFDGVATVRAFVIGNKIYAYYPQGGAQIAPNQPASIVGSVSSDGKKFTSVSSIMIAPHDGFTMDGPGVFQLKDGTYRMYFVEFDMSDVTKRQGKMWGASSSDGKTWVKDDTFTMEAEASVEGTQPWPQLLHPTIVNYEDGFIMLYNSHSRFFWAYSEDGLVWDKRGLVTNNGNMIDGADIDAFWISDHELRIYFGDFSHETGGVIYTATLNVE